MAKRRNTKGDVAWYEPKRKRPIAYSTKATSDYIVLLAESGKTISEVYNLVNYNQEAKKHPSKIYRIRVWQRYSSFVIQIESIYIIYFTI